MYERDDGRRNSGFTFAGAPSSMANGGMQDRISQPGQQALARFRKHSFPCEFDFLPTRLIESPVFQRLRSVSQLGFVHRVWPQATHTRYDHSLGCYDLARSALAHIFSTLPPHMPMVLSREHLRTFLIAALLHDVGHLPFSHSLDGLRSLLPSHEQGGRQRIEGELGTILERDYHLVPSRVADLIDPPCAAEEVPKAERLLCLLLDGPCDVDKLDYVARDASSCGFSSGAMYSAALLQALRFHWSSREPGEARLALAASVRRILQA